MFLGSRADSDVFGPTVLRMLSSHVGEDKFLKGVSIYLKKHLYKNAVTKDLWEGIQASTDLDIPKIMNTWIKEVSIISHPVAPKLTRNRWDTPF